MKLIYSAQPALSHKYLYKEVNRSTDDQVSGTIADDIEAEIEALASSAGTTRELEDLTQSVVKSYISNSILPRMPDSNTPLPIDTFHAGKGGQLRLRKKPGSAGSVINTFIEGKHEALFQGEIEPVPKDDSGQSRLNYHMWLKVKVRDINTGAIVGEGWMSGEYLQGDLKDIVEPEPDPETITGCDLASGKMAIKNAETGEVIRLLETSCPEGEPEPETPCEEPEAFDFSIDQILPEFAEYVELDPTLPGWFQYTEAFNQVPLGRQREIQTEIEAVLRQKMADAFNGGIDAKIAAAQAAGDTQQENYFEAMKALSPLTGAGSGNITLARQQLALAGTPGQEVLDTMNHDFNRINQGQILAMFEATESSVHEAHMDNWAITNYFSSADDGSQDRINLIHKVSPVMLEIFQARQADFSTILEVINDALANPATLPSNISAADLQTFKTYWENHLAGAGRPMAQLDSNDPDFLDQMQATSQAEWLKIAEQMNEEGQYDQAQQILEKIVLGAKFPSGDSVEDQLNTLLTTAQITEVTADVNRELAREMPRDQVVKMYEEQGFFTDEGLEGFGLVPQAGGLFLDPIAGSTVTRPQAINLIVDQAITVTREKLTTEKMLWEVSNNDQLLNAAANGTLSLDTVQTAALDLYKDISGAGAEWGNISSKRADYWRKELLLNVGLIAVSATGVGLLALGGRAVALGARAVGATARGAKLLNSTTRTARYTRGAANLATTAVVDGAVFHNINAAISTPIVGAAAFDNYGEGLAHSVGMYAAFGVGNAAWAGGVSKVAGGTAFERLSTQTFRDGIRNGWGEAGLTFLANQPKLAAEALAFTQIATDAEFGSAEYFEEFGKQLVTMNLLWGLPKVQPPRRLMIEDMRGRPLTETTQVATRPRSSGEKSVKPQQNVSSNARDRASLKDVMARRERLISEKANREERGQKLSAVKESQLVELTTQVQFLEARVSRIDSDLARPDLGIGRVRLPRKAEVQEVKRRANSLIQSSVSTIATNASSLRTFVRRTTTNLTPTSKTQATEVVAQSSRLTTVRESVTNTLTFFTKGSRERRRLYNEEGAALTTYSKSIEGLSIARTALRTERAKTGRNRNAETVARLQVAQNVALTHAQTSRTAYRETVQKSVSNDVVLVKRDILTYQTEMSSLRVGSSKAVKLQAKIIQLQKIEVQLRTEQTTRTKSEETTSRTKTEKSTRVKETTTLQTREKSLNNSSSERTVKIELETTTQTLLKSEGRVTGVRIETGASLKDAVTIRTTDKFYDRARANQAIVIKSGETKQIDLLNQTVVITRNGNKIETYLTPRTNYTIEGVNFTFQSGKTYKSPSTEATFLRQSSEGLIFNVKGKEQTFTIQEIRQLVDKNQIAVID